jgi:hypothetical protein
MLLELVLAAAVLSLAGLAGYQADNKAKTPVAATTKPSTAAATTLAETAAKAVEADSASDAVLSASAESSAGEVMATDDDINKLGGSFDENSF